MTISADEFVYKLPGNVAGNKPGAHHSHSRGAGLAFAAHARLFDQPDPRRIDLHASLCAIPRNWMVRTHYQRAAIVVSAIVDVSASMHCAVPRNKLELVADFLKALGFSAFRAGDAVSLMAFDQGFREDLYLAPRWSRGIGAVLADRIGAREARAAPANALRGLAECLERAAGGRGGLVFLVSDFHWPLDNLELLLPSLRGTMVVPIVVWDAAEIDPPARTGLLSLRDAESGEMRHLWLSQRTRQRWRAKLRQRRREIDRAFAAHDIFPFHLNGVFDGGRLSSYFLEQNV